MNGKRWAALGIAAALFFFSLITSLATSIFFSAEEGGFFAGFSEVFEATGGTSVSYTHLTLPTMAVV